MTDTTTQALRLAREALNNAADVLDEAQSYTSSESHSPSMTEECQRAVRIARAALAAIDALPAGEPAAPAVQAEPVAWWIPKAEQFCIAKPGERPFAKAWQPLYAAPTAQPAAQAPRALTDAEIDAVTDQQWAYRGGVPVYAAHRAYARAIERAHGIQPAKGEGE